uniref:Protein kinase domain-containing protein n=1 Tax=Caenorhabditis tropicalis TaxID=1561998 RepID=A0A1I7TSL5_9PELO
MSAGKSGSKLSSFKNLKQIGQGGFGIVYSAQRENGEKVAIKKIGKAAVQSRIREEIKTMKQLDHRNIVKFYESFVDNDDTYLVMELCEGGSLISYVKERGPLDDSTAVHILRQLISAVTYIHRENKLHRDLSAGNVFIKDATKSKITVKLGDFGLATNIGYGGTACTIVGTPGYIAPQVFDQNYDQAADVYSLGAVLYTMLTAKPPPPKGFPKTTDISNENAKRLIEEMMHPDVRKRIQLKEIVMTAYMRENTDEEARLYSRENSRDSRRPRSREPVRSSGAYSNDKKPFGRSSSQPAYSGRELQNNRLNNHDRLPGTSRDNFPSANERGRERQRNCGQGLGPSHEYRMQTWPIRMERLAGQRIRTAGGRYIVEMDTRCRFEVASQGNVIE